MLAHFIQISPQLVDRRSAVVPGATNAEPVGLHKDHLGMSKFAYEDDADYDILSSQLFQMAKAAPSKIVERWESFNRKQGKHPDALHLLVKFHGALMIAGSAELRPQTINHYDQRYSTYNNVGGNQQNYMDSIIHHSPPNSYYTQPVYNSHGPNSSTSVAESGPFDPNAVSR